MNSRENNRKPWRIPTIILILIAVFILMNILRSTGVTDEIVSQIRTEKEKDDDEKPYYDEDEKKPYYEDEDDEEEPIDVDQLTPQQKQYVDLLDRLQLSYDTPVIDYARTNASRTEEAEAAFKKFPDRVVFLNRLYESNEGWSYNFHWVKDRFSYSSYTIDGQDVYVVYVDYYTKDQDEIDEMKKEIDAVADDILGQIPNGSDMWESARVIHDELVKRMTYDQTLNKDHCRDIYSLVTGEPVCVGYAGDFAYLMRKLGYEFYVVLSDVEQVPQDKLHAWNRMSPDMGYKGNDVYIDVTWDDQDKQDGDGDDVIIYTYFGVTNDWLSQEECHKYVGWCDESGQEGDFNYHRHEGYYLDTYSYQAAADILKKQYDAGLDQLNIRMGSTAEYKKLTKALESGDLSVNPMWSFYSNSYRWASDGFDGCTSLTIYFE